MGERGEHLVVPQPVEVDRGAGVSGRLRTLVIAESPAGLTVETASGRSTDEDSKDVASNNRRPIQRPLT